MITLDQFVTELEKNLSGATPVKLSPDIQFRNLPFWDSLAVLTTVETFDMCFGAQLGREELAACHTIRDIYAIASKSV